MFQPWLEETRRRLPDLPLWDPYIMGGRPLQANTQSAVFSPFSLPTYVLGLWSSLALVAALKVFLAALGTFSSRGCSGCAWPRRASRGSSSASACGASAGSRGRR